MKKNRPKSTNIVDNRAYFGTASVDPTYSTFDRNYDFIKDTLRNPVQEINKKVNLTAPLHEEYLDRVTKNDRRRIDLIELDKILKDMVNGR